MRRPSPFAPRATGPFQMPNDRRIVRNRDLRDDLLFILIGRRRCNVVRSPIGRKTYVGEGFENVAGGPRLAKSPDGRAPAADPVRQREAGTHR